MLSSVFVIISNRLSPVGRPLQQWFKLQELLGSVSMDAHLGNGRHVPAAEHQPGRGASPQQSWQPWLSGRPESLGQHRPRCWLHLF